MEILLPIIIGLVTVFLVMIIIAIFIVRIKKSRLKYDLEKTEEKSDEECEKLNTCFDNQPDVIGVK